MNKRRLLITGLLLAALCAAAILVRGTTYTLAIPTYGKVSDADEVRVELGQETQSVVLVNRWLENGTLCLQFRSVCPGKAWVSLYRGEDPLMMARLLVHRNGVITRSTFFGDCSGDWIIPLAVTLFLLLLLRNMIRVYRRSVRENLYQYRNVKYLGMIIYFSAMLPGQIRYLLFSSEGLAGAAESIMRTSSTMAILVFPVAFVVSILVTVSNIRLMRREGRTWRNMLGCALGVLLCLTTIFPDFLSHYLQWNQGMIDVHREDGIWHHVFMAVENGILVMLTYLECILLGTVILGFKAARRIPAFDKDYILILGCQINSDGTLTNLLKGRADRALEFARMQREAVGREITFVPSGGQGGDEIISEGKAIRNYLVSAGVAPERILTEDRSANTDENFRNSLALIRQDAGQTEPKIAFSTTNYHVFRAGILATEQGIRAEGIGSRTKSYFWINAFVREFIATLVNEWKTHVSITAVMLLIMLALVGVVYMSNVL